MSGVPRGGEARLGNLLCAAEAGGRKEERGILGLSSPHCQGSGSLCSSVLPVGLCYQGGTGRTAE